MNILSESSQSGFAHEMCGSVLAGSRMFRLIKRFRVIGSDKEGSGRPSVLSEECME